MDIPEEYIQMARKLGGMVARRLEYDREEAEGIALLKLCEIFPRFQGENIQAYLYKAIFYECLAQKKKAMYYFLEDLLSADEDSRSWEEVYFGQEDSSASYAALGELLDRVLAKFPAAVPKEKIRAEIMACPENVGQILRQYMPGKPYILLFAQYVAQEGRRRKVC